MEVITHWIPVVHVFTAERKEIGGEKGREGGEKRIEVTGRVGERRGREERRGQGRRERRKRRDEWRRKMKIKGTDRS